jgi:hypothetical protein
MDTRMTEAASTPHVRPSTDGRNRKEQIEGDIALLERLSKDATVGTYIPMDCRHCAAPADCVDYAVVSTEAGRVVSRVWRQEDALFQAAASPERILRLLTGYRQLEDENRRLKAGLRPHGESWVSALLRETAQSIPADEVWENPVPTD